MVDVVIADVTLATGVASGPDIVIGDITLAASSTAPNIVIADVTLSAGNATPLEPFQLVDIPGGPWTQTGGTTVTVTNGTTFVTPATMAGTTLTFVDGFGGSVAFNVLPHTFWALVADADLYSDTYADAYVPSGSWVPFPIYDAVLPASTPLFPDSGVFPDDGRLLGS